VNRSSGRLLPQAADSNRVCRCGSAATAYRGNFQISTGRTARRCPRLRTRNSRSRSSLRPSKSRSRRLTETLVHGQLFRQGAPGNPAIEKPGVIFSARGAAAPNAARFGVTWNTTATATAVNQYLAAHGFRRAVGQLSVSASAMAWRFIIPSTPVSRGAAEYQDVVGGRPASCNRCRASMASA